MSDIIREAAVVGELTGSRQEITIATPGWGSSGYYSAKVLEQAAVDRVFTKGTQMHIDHDGEMARFEQPAGSLTKLAAALDEDARWQPDWVDPDTGVKGRLVAEADVYSPWRAFLKEAKAVIGASLSASAEVSKGTAEGRKGIIVEKLLPSPLNRVDYVTKAGRGGRISAILESANLLLSETVANDIRKWLSQAVRDTHATEDNWAYMEDHSDEFVFFESNRKTYRQGYTLDGVNVTLSGDPVEVRRRVEYDPVTVTAAAEGQAPAAAPEDSSPIPAEVTQEAKSKETNMAEVNVEEARLRTLEESHGRVPALEAKVEAAEARVAEAEKRAATAESTVRARDFATTIVQAANAELSEATVSRIVATATAQIPLTEALQLDTDALTESVNAARLAEETYLAKLAKENGLGQIRGIGATESAEAPEASRAEILEALKGAK